LTDYNFQFGIREPDTMCLYNSIHKLTFCVRLMDSKWWKRRSFS